MLTNRVLPTGLLLAATVLVGACKTQATDGETSVFNHYRAGNGE